VLLRWEQVRAGRLSEALLHAVFGLLQQVEELGGEGGAECLSLLCGVFWIG
jgi:hypothetical protein